MNSRHIYFKDFEKDESKTFSTFTSLLFFRHLQRLAHLKFSYCSLMVESFYLHFYSKHQWIGKISQHFFPLQVSIKRSCMNCANKNFYHRTSVRNIQMCQNSNLLAHIIIKKNIHFYRIQYKRNSICKTFSKSLFNFPQHIQQCTGSRNLNMANRTRFLLKT